MRKGFERLGREIQVGRAKRMCLEKKPFDSRNEARDFGIRGEKYRGHTTQEPYHCRLCGKFHLATVRPNRAKGKR